MLIVAAVSATLIACDGGGSGTDDNIVTSTNDGTGSSAESCSALKSGTYSYIDPTDDIDSAVQSVEIDATAMTVSSPSGTLTLSSNSDCNLSVTDTYGAKHELLVSSAGVIVDRVTEAGGSGIYVALLLPQQDLSLSVLSGDWVGILLGRPEDNWESLVLGTTFDSQGTVTSFQRCRSTLSNCETINPSLAFVKESSGGFSVTEDDGFKTRLIVYETTAGQKLGVMIDSDDGSLALMTQSSTLTLPSSGDSSTYWQMSLSVADVSSGQPSVGAIGTDTLTVTSVDSSTGSYMQTFSSDNHSDVQLINNPWDGLRLRNGSSCASAGSGTYDCQDLVQLPLTELGLTASISVSGTSPTMNITVVQP